MISTTPLQHCCTAAPTKQVATAYVAFLVSVGAVYVVVADQEFACIQTVAGMLQCFAMILLAMQVLGSRSVEGVSANSLALHALAFACRLSSTTWLNGYLPADPSGDWIYQAFDVLSLLIASRLLMQIMASGASGSRKPKLDIAVVMATLFLALVLAAVFRANMDKRPVFDTLWMAGVFLASAAIVPQLLALHALPPRANPLAGHALASMAMAQLLSAVYMWHARNDMTTIKWVKGFNQSAGAVLVAHLLPLLITCDFSREVSPPR